MQNSTAVKTARKTSKKSAKGNVSVIGLGKLGSCYAAFYAGKGYNVTSFDVDPLKVKAVKSGKAPVIETGLSELIEANHERLKATSDSSGLVKYSDITFIIVPTPSKKNGLFSLEYVLSVAKAIGPEMKKKDRFHTIVLVSTVLPGDSRKYIIPAFERHSGKKCGEEWGYAYSPSLVAIGDILYNLNNPDFLFLGASDEKTRAEVAKIYTDIHPTKPIEHMNLESAEIAKISLNSYVTMKITFANMLGNLCSMIPNADVDQVTSAIGKDKRIGTSYFRSGLGYGGPCFPRDNFALANISKKFGSYLPSVISLATHRLNNSIWKRVADQILELTNKGDSIGMTGISYKPRTCVTEDSQALFIAEELIQRKRQVVLFEPAGYKLEALRILKDKARYVESLADLTKKSKLIFISNNDKAFSSLPDLIRGKKGSTTILDPWGMFRPGQFGKNVVYISIGRNNS